MSAKSAVASAPEPPAEWNLADILPSRTPADVDAALAKLETTVKKIEAYRPKLDALRTPQDLQALIALEAEASEVAQRLEAIGSLAFSVDTRDGAVKAYLNRIENVLADVENRTRFFSLWWKQLDEARAASLTPADADLQYYLKQLRVFRPYTRSEDEERIISLKDVSGDSALSKIRQILTSNFRFKDPKTGETVTESELVRRVRDSDPKLRVQAYAELWRVYGENEPLLSTIYQSCVTDWVNETVKIRGYKSPIGARNLGNDVPDEVVETLLGVVRKNAPTFQRYFMWKGKQLGLGAMSREHIYAPLKPADEKIPWPDARATVLEAMGNFSPRLRAGALQVFDERHLHAKTMPGKRGGAFCATVASRLTPYVFMNYTGETKDVSTLSHELGHAVHSVLARDRHPFVAHASLPLAETASVFSEMLLHKALTAKASPEARVELTAEKVADAYATIVRQAYFVMFEKEAHATIPDGASSDDLQKVYLQNLREQFGPVVVPDTFRLEWMYIPHIFETPFYCYAYAFGMLLSLALYGAYEKEGASFVPRYESLLAAGGSAGAVELLGRMGYDARDPAFWQGGFSVIEGMVRSLEKGG
ncbi:MAG: M3 family oligoendopeptidase [Thermoplasmatota archaeon]